MESYILILIVTKIPRQITFDKMANGISLKDST